MTKNFCDAPHCGLAVTKEENGFELKIDLDVCHAGTVYADGHYCTDAHREPAVRALFDDAFARATHDRLRYH